MGQSDSESTSSSMRGNPGSPRDISVIFDEPVADIQSCHNISPISPAISTSSSEASELDNSVILINQTPKQSEIPVIDLTSTDDSGNGVIAGSPEIPASGPICDDFAQFASNFRLRQALGERLAGRDLRNSRSRLLENRLRGRRFRSRHSPYTALHGDLSYSGRHGNLPQSGRVSGAVPASAADNDDHMAPIIIDDELSPYANHQAQYSNATNRMSSDSDDPVSLSIDAERIRHHFHLENSRQFREARAVLDRIQPIHPRCFLQSDEALAQRMQQDEYSREIEEQHRLRESSIHQSTPNVGAGFLPTPLPVRRRRPLRPHFGPQGLQELLLPFVSVVSLPPPLHHYGDSGPGHSTEGEDYEALWNLSERIGLAKARGLSKEVIDCIPSFRYSASSKDSSNGSCVVCMSDYIKPEKLRRLPCHHDFHAKCIDRWLKNNRTCPVCREQVSDP